MKRVFALGLCAVMMLGLLGGCGKEETGKTLEIAYDDRLAVSELSDSVAATVEISEQNVTSEKVSRPGEKDDAVLIFDKEDGKLIAVGTGTATVKVNGVKYEVKVAAAPISLFMITGHSIGAGQGGDPEQNILCEAGQVYTTHGYGALDNVKDNTGIGYGSEHKPDGIYAFSEGGKGSRGEASGIAYAWTQKTQEKVWVINAGDPGSCIDEWLPGQPNYENAVDLYQRAERILKNEVAAGHYVVKDMAIIYHSGANFVNQTLNKKVEYTQEDLRTWYDTMWNGFKTACAVDFDGDAKMETVTDLGFVSFWAKTNYKSFAHDKPATYYMCASKDFSEYFDASSVGYLWQSDEDVLANFPKPEYETLIRPVKQPDGVDRLFVDKAHYLQVGYNALGMDIGQNLYTRLRTQIKANSVTLMDGSTGDVLPDQVTLQVGKTLKVVPFMDPVPLSDLTFTVSGNLKVSYPYFITADAPGTGTLTVSQGDTVLETVTITVTQG